MTPSELLDECSCGYFEGRDLDTPVPSHNRTPAFIHGFRCGRDDAECDVGLRKFPSRDANKARSDWSYIESTCQ